ncbi:MAG TPA: FMN-binding negative transcriptional regulator [Marmoricola sp.]|nr:FMN-binding negative transcriptional regulator [Marmoricola sp.]
MYVPHFNRMGDDEVAAFLDAVGTAELVTVGPDGFPVATLLPFVRDGDRLLMHLARANSHWQAIEPGTPALAVVAGPQAYVSPSWYATKQEHGKVVPTWNYSAVHLTGRVTTHHDEEWLRDVVRRLTDQHERHRPDAWSLEDAPDDYVRKQLRAIVGVELVVERVEAKAKLSQNRSDPDRAGVIHGLEETGVARDHLVAGDMRRLER